MSRAKREIPHYYLGHSVNIGTALDWLARANATRTPAQRLLPAALFIMDIYAPTHGVLTVGGIVSFFLGALMLFDRSEPAFRLSLSYIIPATLLTAAFFLFIVGAGLRAQFLPTRTGREAMLGKRTAAVAAISPDGGKVFVEGEYWNAVSDFPIDAGQPVEIVSMTGLTLKVKPAAVEPKTEQT